MPGGMNEDQEGPVDGEWVDYTSPLHPCYGIEGTLNYPAPAPGENGLAYADRMALDKDWYAAQGADYTFTAAKAAEVTVNKAKMADKAMNSMLKFIKS